MSTGSRKYMQVGLNRSNSANFCKPLLVCLLRSNLYLCPADMPQWHIGTFTDEPPVSSSPRPIVTGSAFIGIKGGDITMIEARQAEQAQDCRGH